ncbi:MAG: L-threonylcarbamoyladenylate synthase [Armatimonadota bacterium]|nr:L-threonylcarbamoyladenylate synthase [Armatimonadota bacterium]MDR7426044.1 L-threonylcarbamoyladenylate synthase [Armatimonadota bacterium]MDR7463192.1 L-threonylcarbamoyladenylate synthase [Armatimonadota bacterium]MDR7469428.1 L-threonylcarbamoyladenylate synthase [Armatimonadota bacterium]MDR7474245.1 L-threonylcarbamoyladenylate synthase [Armatimonadota bacterium]
MSPAARSYYDLSFQPAVRPALRPLRIIRVTEDIEAPRQAIRLIQEGGLLAYPTDTVYGIGCNAHNNSAVLRVYAVKHRPRSDPLPLLIADREQLAELVAEVPEVAERLMARFWPGALTLILRKGRGVSSLVTAGGEHVAVRLPDHPLPRSLVRGAGVPIVGTSANLHGSISPTTAQHVAFELGDRVDMILDGGRTRHGRESTVVDATMDPPRVVRAGVIPPAAIEEALR